MKLTRNIHAEVKLLLPWLVNDSLEDRERIKVQAHLMDCQECQVERDRLQTMQETLIEDVPESSFQTPFRDLLSRIEVSERNKQALRLVPRQVPRMGFEWKGLLTAGSGVPALVTIALLVVSAVYMQVPSRDDRNFHTLTEGMSHPGIEHRVRVSFESDASVEQVREVLVDIGANIIDGPNEDGAYLVDLVVPASLTDNEFIVRLAQRDGIRKAVYYLE